MDTNKRRILLACMPTTYVRLRSALSDYDVVVVNTLADADTALRTARFELVMIGVYFDESSMFDLLQEMRADDHYARIPVVCFRGAISSEAQADISLDVVQVTCKAVGADAFFDLAAFAEDAAGNAAICRIINGLLDSKKP